MPVSIFQMLFALVNPMQAALKFQKLARLDPDGAAARHFVALEDWLADGVPMAAPARAGPADRLADPQRHRGAGLALPRRRGRPARDPHAGAGVLRRARLDRAAGARLRPAGARSPGAQVVQPRTGHVGMVVGSAARAQVWRPMADFLHAHAG